MGLLDGAGTSLLNAAAAMAGSALQYKYSKKLAEQQNQYNIDMWKMQADYNSPQAQMQRFKQAGLNPNLIYGQGDNGNMSSPPQLHAPAPPDIEGAADKIAKAFNLENLRTQVANRKKAQEEAKQANLTTKNMQDERSALHRLGFAYEYDMKTGRFKLVDNSNAVIRSTNLPTYELPTDIARMNKYLASVDPRMFMYSSQRRYLEPQIWMSNYEKQHYPTSYWIGQTGKAIHAGSELVGTFMPSKWFMNLGKSGGAYRAPNGKIYYY